MISCKQSEKHVEDATRYLHTQTSHMQLVILETYILTIDFGYIPMNTWNY